jgi:hypothetical protein
MHLALALGTECTCDRQSAVKQVNRGCLSMPKSETLSGAACKRQGQPIVVFICLRRQVCLVPSRPLALARLPAWVQDSHPCNHHCALLATLFPLPAPTSCQALSQHTCWCTTSCRYLPLPFHAPPPPACKHTYLQTAPCASPLCVQPAPTSCPMTPQDTNCSLLSHHQHQLCQPRSRPDAAAAAAALCCRQSLAV